MPTLYVFTTEALGTANNKVCFSSFVDPGADSLVVTQIEISNNAIAENEAIEFTSDNNGLHVVQIDPPEPE